MEVTYDKLYEEITSPSHIAKIRLGFKNKDKYRRPFEEEVSKMCYGIAECGWRTGVVISCWEWK